MSLALLRKLFCSGECDECTTTPVRCVPCRCCFSDQSTATVTITGEDYSSLLGVTPNWVAIPAQLSAASTTLWFFNYTRVSGVQPVEVETTEEVYDPETDSYIEVPVTVTEGRSVNVSVQPPCGRSGLATLNSWRIVMVIGRYSYDPETEEFTLISTESKYYRIGGNLDLPFSSCCTETWTAVSDLSGETVSLTLTIINNKCCKCGTVGSAGAVTSIDPWTATGCQSRATVSTCNETNGENTCAPPSAGDLPTSVTVTKPTAEEWAAFTSGLSEPFTLGDWDGTLQLDEGTLTYTTSDVIFYDAGSTARGQVTYAYDAATCRWVLTFRYTVSGSIFWEGRRSGQNPIGSASRTSGDDATSSREIA